MTGPDFGIIPRRVTGLDLTGADHRVLLVIACHARKETRIARLSIETIAHEVSLDRRTVQRAMRRLEAKRILKPLRGGGRGRSSEYQIIFTLPADATKSVDGATASDADDTGNSGNDAAGFAETAAFSELNSVTSAAPTEPKQKEKKTPPSGESHTHAREEREDLSIAGVDENPGVLLLPIQAGGDRMAQVRRHNPSAALVDWAREQYGINALDDAVLGGFIDWHVEHDALPGNGSFEAIEAGYRRWIRREARFAKQARHRPQYHSNAGEAESEAVVDAFRRMRTMTANGAGHD